MSVLSNIRNSALITSIRKFVPDELVNNTLHLTKAKIANQKYNYPSKELTIIGVTGTDGKTTTSTMLYHILHSAGYKVALLTTVAAKIGDKELDTGFHVTTPDPEPLQRILREIADKGFTHVVLEATSHGFAQNRLHGVDFDGGIITNISEDHLLYHKTMENYANAKAHLFAHTKFSILNQDDDWYEYIRKQASGKIITYGQTKGDWNLQDFKFKLNMIGEYNQMNALAASAAADQLGIDEKTIKQALQSFEGIRGRMQIMQTKPFLVVVDFAHTPNALKNSLQTLKNSLSPLCSRENAKRSMARGLENSSQSKLISVFGCAGLRDVNRRKMGYESAKRADITIITAEDPRTEGIEKISNEIASWAEKGGAKLFKTPFDKGGRQAQHGRGIFAKTKNFNFPIYIRIPDRQKAINFAISIAKAGDIVGIFGKGHEQSMCFGTEEISWTDQQAVKKALTS